MKVKSRGSVVIVGVLLVVVCAAGLEAAGQDNLGATDVSFDVASVKPWSGREVGGVHTFQGGRVALRGCTLLLLIQQAYAVQAFQVSGGPPWFDTVRYDIEAKPPAQSRSAQSRPTRSVDPLTDEQRQMLRSLLAVRFRLECRRLTTEGPIYLLARGVEKLRLEDAKDKTAYPWSGGLGHGMITGDGLLGVNESMTDLAWRLSRYLERPVIDRTGLSGSFDFRVERPLDDPHPDVIRMIFTAVNELGLRLQPSRGPIDRIVVVHAGPPSED
jgi:uncharacterized protein (TIGR03435 family)